MSLSSPSPAEHDSSSGLQTKVTEAPHSTCDETIQAQRESADDIPQEPRSTQSETTVVEVNQHVTFGAPPPTGPSAQFTDTGSTYHSARSRISLRSIFTRSTGKRSQHGATWLRALTNTMNSGFGSGAPRGEKYTGVVEGREKGHFLPRMTGVGRTGKAPAPVPTSMLRALGVSPAAEAQASSLPLTMLEDSTSNRGFWRISLEDLRERDGSAVPIIVYKCLQAVERYGLHERFIYHQSRVGKGPDVKQLRERIEANDTTSIWHLDLNDPQMFSGDIRVIVEVLFDFLESLPETVVNVAYAPAFKAAVFKTGHFLETETDSKRREMIRSITLHLSKANYETLKLITKHLTMVIRNSKSNGYDSRILARVWEGYLFGFQDTGGVSIEGEQTIQSMIEHHDYIFGSGN